MKLTVIGKYGPYPEKNGRTSCYLLQTEQAALALDFGSGAVAGIQNFLPLDKLDAIVLSHLHFDHMSDMLPLAYYGLTRSVRPSVYCPFDESTAFQLLFESGRFDLKRIENGSGIQAGCFSIEFCRMEHLVESYAMRITDGKSVFVYTGDLTFSDHLLPFLKGADTVLMDCCGGTVHASIADAERVAEQTGARVLATHFYPGVTYASDHPNVTLVEEETVYII